ncbi:MAG TPA: methyltransferase domain-containing protein [Thermoanaerobaculia bacterium]|nr:methyltransferase domain-containing protein [Thermoanaerobaculia bacterium]
MQSRYQWLAANYDRRWQGYVAASTRETLRRAGVRASDRLLDIGCGTGALLAAVRGAVPAAAVTGIDLVPAMLAVARRKAAAGPGLAAADAVRLPFRPCSFDVVVSSSSFHYWHDPRLGLSEIARVLRPGGRVVLTDWCADFLACRICDAVLRLIHPVHRRVYRRAECARLLAEAGFIEGAVERYKIDWLWGLMTATACTACRTA